MDEKQDEYIKAILLNHILTEEEKVKVKKLVTNGLNYEEAEAIINRYESIKDGREKKKELVDKILKQKKKNLVHASIIYEWANISKLEDLYNLTEDRLGEVLEKIEKYKGEV